MGQEFRCGSEETKENFRRCVDELFKKHKVLTFEWRVGGDGTLKQNALINIWVRIYAAHLLKVPEKMVTKEQLVGMKRTLKKWCYGTQGHSFLAFRITEMFTGDTKLEYRSSSDYLQGERFIFLEWIQMYAADNHGLILEAKGEYAKLKREQNE